MNFSKKILYIFLIALMAGAFPAFGQEEKDAKMLKMMRKGRKVHTASMEGGEEKAPKPERPLFRQKEPGGIVNLIDFKKTPMVNVLKVFTDLTEQNVVGTEKVMKLNVTLFLKNVKPEEAIKTMCKLYNLWYRKEDNIIRIVTAEEYSKELTIKYDEKNVVYQLKYASCLAVADLLESIYGDRIEYDEPEEIESYGHVGTDGEELGVGTGRDSAGSRDDGYRRGYDRYDRDRGYGRSGSDRYRSRTRRYDLTWGGPWEGDRALFERELTSVRIEELEKKIDEAKVDISEELIKARARKPMIYLGVFVRNNAIAVRSADKQSLKDIGEIIKSIDTPSKEVLIEAKVLSVRLTDSLSSFFDFEITPGNNRIQTGGFGETLINNPTLVYEFMDSQIEMRMEMFAEDDRLKAIGTPIILCANNAWGEFFIGEQRPITINYEFEIYEFEDRTTQTTRPVIELRDIGTKIAIAPSINEDETVTLRVLTEISHLSEDGAQIYFMNQEGEVVGLPIDTVDTHTVKNIMVADNGSTLAIGGLIRESDRLGHRKVPNLGDIPFIGLFFQWMRDHSERVETVILLTPHIIMRPDEGDAVSKHVMARLSEHPYIKEDQEHLMRYNERRKELKTIYPGYLEGEIWTVDKNNSAVMINLGKNDGVKRGDKFTVYSRNEPIGCISVTDYWHGRSIADIIYQPEKWPIKQGDEIRSEIQHPSFLDDESERPPRYAENSGQLKSVNPGPRESRIWSVNQDTKSAIIDLGENDGVKRGEEFTVYRRKKPIGKVRVKDFFNTRSIAEIIDQPKKRPIRKGDEVRGEISKQASPKEP